MEFRAQAANEVEVEKKDEVEELEEKEVEEEQPWIINPSLTMLEKRTLCREKTTSRIVACKLAEQEELNTHIHTQKDRHIYWD